MDLEKLERRVDAISAKMKELGYDMKEDIEDLLEQRPDIAELILTTKLKSIDYFADEENNRAGFYIANLHITFQYIYGEDEEGPWYEVDCHVLDVSTGDE